VTEQRIVGAGAAGLAGHERGGVPGLATQDMILNIGPQHPATHGVLRLRLTLGGGRIVACEPIVCRNKKHLRLLVSPQMTTARLVRQPGMCPLAGVV